MPQAILPSLEAATNYNSWTGRPILNQFMEPGPYAYRASTTQLARDIGEITEVSPLKIEHMVRGHLGMMGTYAMLAMNSIIQGGRKALGGEVRDRPDWDITQMPGLRRFLHSGITRGQLEEFYELKAVSDEVYQAVKKFTITDPEKAKKLRKENKGALRIRGQLNAMANSIRNMTKRKNRINESKASGAEKKKQIDKINRQINKRLSNIDKLKRKADLPAFGGVFR
jgi:hypothetical protein